MKTASISFVIRKEKCLPYRNKVYLVGDVAELGNLRLQDSRELRPLKHSEGDVNETFQVTVDIPMGCEVSYFYFLGNVFENNGSRDVLVSRWENLGHARMLRIQDEESRVVDDGTFGNTLDSVNCTKRGWLTSQYEFRLHIHNSRGYPISIIDKAVNPKNLKVKVCHLTQHEEANVGNFLLTDLSSSAVKREQETFGCSVSEESFLTFSLQKLKLIDLNIGIYVYAEDKAFSHWRIYGQAFISSELLKKSEEELHLVLIDSKAQCIVGHVSVDYLVVKPWNNPICYTHKPRYESPLAYHSPHNIGHRGCGSSLCSAASEKSETENTLTSFFTAAENGADFIEFDVVITKDLVPVVYHDFCTGCLVSQIDGSKIKYNAPVNSFMYEELQRFVMIGEENFEQSKSRLEQSKDDQRARLFPSLQEVLNQLPESLGFLVEVKYPQMLVDGTHELADYIDANVFVDAILDVLYHYGKNRRIILTCFAPSIVVMLKLKQPLYPVILTTCGRNDVYVPYVDHRTADISLGTTFAVSEELEGLSLFSNPVRSSIEDVRRIIKEHGLVMFTWGTANNDYEFMVHQRVIGVDGIIHDRMKEFYRKENS